MGITATQVKALRERTGSGMMECKRALEAANGDIEAAIEAMRKAGQAQATKKAGRIAVEGIIVIALSDDQKRAFMAEVNCETDFVARDEQFKAFANTIAARGLVEKMTDVSAMAGLSIEANGGDSIEETREKLIAKIGENIGLRRIVYVEAKSALGVYQHGNRIGVLVEMDSTAPELAKDVAMHVAASNPQVVSPSDVPTSLIDKEKEIYLAQAADSGKPPEIIEKMVAGRIKKFLKEVSLLGQPFVKDPNQSVEALLQSAKASVRSFERFEVGEGLEKRKEDFADEVMAQVQGSE